MLASTFMDMCMGVDIHFEMVPMPAPVPTPLPNPFVGMVFDPVGLLVGQAMGYAMAMATGTPPTGPVFINGMPANNVGTESKNYLGVPHIIIPPGTAWTPMPKAPKPSFKGPPDPPGLPVAPEGDAVHVFGSQTVNVMGSSAVRMGDMAMSCAEPVRLPTSCTLAIPKGAPVLIGGPPSINLMAALGALVRTKWVAGHLHSLISRMAPGRLRNFLHKAACFFTGHPVDVATGRLMTAHTDFVLPGPLPLKLERNYASSWANRAGAMGHGWHHSLDEAVWAERGKLVYLAEDGREIEFDTFDFPQHRLPLGQSVYDPTNRLTLRFRGEGRFELEDAQGLVREFARVPGARDGREAWSRIVHKRTRDGHSQRYAYEARANLGAVRDASGRVVYLEHDERDRLISIKLPHPSVDGWVVHTRYVYDRAGDLTQVVDALGNSFHFKYKTHLMVQETDRTGLSFYFEYDGFGEDAHCIRTWGDGGIYDHRILYDKKGRVTCVTNSLGQMTTYKMNMVGQVTEVIDPMGGTTSYAYDERTLAKVQETSPSGGVTTWEHDDRGNPRRIVLPSGLAFEIEHTPLNRPSVIKTSLEQVWKFQYNDFGQLVGRVDPLGAVTRYRWQQGVLTAIEGTDGAHTEFDYDEQRLVSAVRLPSGGEVRLRYDRRGELRKERDPRGAVVQYVRDIAGRVVELHAPLGLWQRFAYDAEDNVLEAQHPTRHVRLRYAHYHRLIEREEAETTLRFRYDTEDQLIEIQNEAGERYAFELDARGLTTRETGFDGRTRRYQRDAAGKVTQAWLPSGRNTSYVYDPAGKLLELKHSDGCFTKLGWRPDGALLTAQNETEAVSFEVDPLGRIVRETRGEHHIDTRYGVTGKREWLRTNLGAFMRTAPDAHGLPSDLHYGLEQFGLRRESELHIERDLGGLERSRQLPGDVRVAWERDLLGRPVERRSLRAPRGAVARELGASAYKWRGEDQIEALIDAHRGPRVFEHDRRGRLIREARPDAVIERAMDAVGNLFRSRERTDRRFGKGGVLEQAGAMRYEHDEDGNRTAKITADGQTWRYRWNGAGMLSEVERPDGGRVRYQYDALARRTRKQHVRFGPDGAESIEARRDFVWDGHTLVHELDRDRGITTWFWEPESFTPIAKFDGDQQHSIAPDHMGTPSEMYDERGQLAWQMQLDVFGVPHVQAGERDACPFRWPGQYEDAETGLFYNRFRYYDPEAGRYVSHDPLGLGGGTALNSYVPDPSSQADPLGLYFGSTTQVGYWTNDFQDELNQAYRSGDAHIGGNMAVVELVDGQRLPFASVAGVAHSEEAMIAALKNADIQPSQIARIYTERSPCVSRCMAALKDFLGDHARNVHLEFTWFQGAGNNPEIGRQQRQRCGIV